MLEGMQQGILLWWYFWGKGRRKSKDFVHINISAYETNERQNFQQWKLQYQVFSERQAKKYKANRG